jgi:hypothetical protein
MHNGLRHRNDPLKIGANTQKVFDVVAQIAIRDGQTLSLVLPNVVLESDSILDTEISRQNLSGSDLQATPVRPFRCAHFSTYSGKGFKYALRGKCDFAFLKSLGRSPIGIKTSSSRLIVMYLTIDSPRSTMSCLGLVSILKDLRITASNLGSHSKTTFGILTCTSGCRRRT